MQNGASERTVPVWQVDSEVGRDAPGQVHVVLPLFLTQADVLGPPVGYTGLHRLLCRDYQLLGGQRVIPGGEALNLTGLVRQSIKTLLEN